MTHCLRFANVWPLDLSLPPRSSIRSQLKPCPNSSPFCARPGFHLLSRSLPSLPSSPSSSPRPPPFSVRFSARLRQIDSRCCLAPPFVFSLPSSRPFAKCLCNLAAFWFAFSFFLLEFHLFSPLPDPVLFCLFLISVHLCTP